MSFVIPNRDDVTDALRHQSRPDAGDFRILADGHQGIGVRTGCAVTATGSGLQVAVAAGEVTAGDTGPVVAVTAGNLTPDAAPTGPDEARVDLVVADIDDGTKSLLKGTDVVAVTGGDGPAWPAIPADKVVLARLDLTEDLATMVTANIVDKRLFSNPTAPIVLDDLGSEAAIAALTTAPNLGSTEQKEAWAIIWPTSHADYDIVKYGAGHKVGGTGISGGSGVWYPEIPSRFKVVTPFEDAGLSSDYHQGANGWAIDDSDTDPDSGHHWLSGGVSTDLVAVIDLVDEDVSGVLAMVMTRNEGADITQYLAGVVPFAVAANDLYYYGATFLVDRAGSDYAP